MLRVWYMPFVSGKYFTEGMWMRSKQLIPMRHCYVYSNTNTYCTDRKTNFPLLQDSYAYMKPIKQIKSDKGQLQMQNKTYTKTKNQTKYTSSNNRIVEVILTTKKPTVIILLKLLSWIYTALHDSLRRHFHRHLLH